MAKAIAGLAAIAFALALTGPAGAATLPHAKAARGGPLVRTTVSTHGAGPQLPPSFVGFSADYPGADRFSGIPPTGVNDVFGQLADNLSSTGSGAPTFRVGGGSTDESMWNPSKG